MFPNPYMIQAKFVGLDIIGAASKPQWEEREPKVFFVGSPTGGAHFMTEGGYRLHPRLRAAELARERWDNWSILFPFYGPGSLSKELELCAFKIQIPQRFTNPQANSKRRTNPEWNLPYGFTWTVVHGDIDCSSDGGRPSIS
jgi:hypothetical protein